jgi:hypothetical protein
MLKRIISLISSQYVLFRFIALSLSYTISLIIFQKGLLVKRLVIPSKSFCLDTNLENCWIKPRYNKSIILIIDALRYDFIFPYENCINLQRLHGEENFYRGKMVYFIFIFYDFCWG